MAGDRTLSRLNGAVSCVVTVLMCLVVGAMGFQYGPAAFSYVREATTFKPVASSKFTFTSAIPTHSEWNLNGGQFNADQTINLDFGGIMTGNPNRSNNSDAKRTLRAYRP